MRMGLPAEHPVERMLRIVTSQSNLAADAAMVWALPRMHPAYQVAMAEKLVERNHRQGMAGLVGGFLEYCPELQQYLIDHIGGLFEACRLAIGWSGRNVGLG